MKEEMNKEVDEKLTEREEAILKVLADGKPRFISELQEETGMGHRDLHYLIVSRKSRNPNVKRESLLERGFVEEMERHTVKMGGKQNIRTFRSIRITKEGKNRILEQVGEGGQPSPTYPISLLGQGQRKRTNTQ